MKLLIIAAALLSAGCVTTAPRAPMNMTAPAPTFGQALATNPYFQMGTNMMARSYAQRPMYQHAPPRSLNCRYYGPQGAPAGMRCTNY